MKNDALYGVSDIYTLNSFCFVFNTTRSVTILTEMGQPRKYRNSFA